MTVKGDTIFKSVVKRIAVIIVVLIVYIILQYTNNIVKKPDCIEIQDVILVRNQLSAQLNEARRQIGQMQCEVLT